MKKRRKNLEAPDLPALADRAATLGSDEVLDAIDLTLNTMTRYVVEYRRTKLIDLLGETKLSAEAMYVLANELMQRAGAVDRPVAPSRQSRFR